MPRAAPHGNESPKPRCHGVEVGAPAPSTQSRGSDSTGDAADTGGAAVVPGVSGTRVGLTTAVHTLSGSSRTVRVFSSLPYLRRARGTP